MLQDNKKKKETTQVSRKGNLQLPSTIRRANIIFYHNIQYVYNKRNENFIDKYVSLPLFSFNVKAVVAEITEANNKNNNNNNW